MAPPASQGAPAARVAAGQFLTFFLGSEEYGVEILKVQGIIGLLPITPLPRMPSHVKGVINLRGKIVPVVDLRLKLGLPAAGEGPETCIIVVHTDGLETGILVDRVCDVCRVSAADIESPGNLGLGGRADHLLGLAKQAGRVRLLLDIDRTLKGPQAEAAAGAPEDPPTPGGGPG